MAQNIVKYVLDLETKEAQKGLKNLGKDAKVFGSSGRKAFGQVGAGLSGLKAGFDMVAGSMSKLLGVLEAVITKSYEFTQQAVDNINALNDLSNKSAISAKSLQAVTLAFESSGQSAQAAEQAMEQMPRHFQQMRTEGTKANKTLKALGLDPQFMNNEQLLQKTISLIQQVDDKTARADMAMTLFKRSGTKMLQAFSDTADFQSFVSLTERYGINAEKGANSAAAFQKALASLKAVSRGALDTIVQSTGAMDLFRDALRNGVFAVVFTSQAIKLFQGELKSLGQVMLVLIQKIMIPLFKGLAGISPQMSIAFNAMTATIKKGMDVFGKPVALVKFGTKLEMAKNEALKAVESLDKLNVSAEKNDAVTTKLQATIKKLQDELDKERKKKNKVRKSTNSLSKARKNATQSLKELITDYKEQNITVERAIGSIGKLEKRFNKLGMPTKDLNQFKAELENIANQNFIKEIEQKLQSGMKDFETLDLSVSVSGIKQGLAIAAIDFGTQLSNAIAGSGQAVQGLVTNLGGALAGSIAGAFGSLSAIGQQLKQVGDDAVKKVQDRRKEQALDLAERQGRDLSKQEKDALEKQAAFLTAKEQEQIIRQAQLKDARDRVQNFVDGFAIALEVLPEILINVLPGAIAKGVIGILRAIFNLPRNIGNQFMKAIKALRDNFGEGFGNFLSGTGDFILEAITLGFAQTGTFDGKRSGGRFIPSARSGMKFTGPKKSGLALLHENEFVVPASGQKPQSVARTMNTGSGIVINISGMVVESNAVDSIVREIERRFQTFGTSQSTLFGS